MEVAIRLSVVIVVLRKYQFFIEVVPTQMSFIRSVGLDKKITDRTRHRIIGDPRNTKKCIFWARFEFLNIRLDFSIVPHYGQKQINFIMAGRMGHYYQLKYAVIKIWGFCT